MYSPLSAILVSSYGSSVVSSMSLVAASSATNLSSLSARSSSEQVVSKASTSEDNTSNTVVGWVLGGSLAGVLVGIFSTYFPLVADFTFGEVSPTLYYQATYQYDERSLFDNTVLTYGTDYFLAFVMVCWALRIGSHPTCSGSSSSTATTQCKTYSLLQTHSFRSKGLMLSYSLSVLAGAVAHQCFTTIESRNTMAFRLLWTLCVGSVTAAAGWMGSIVTVWAKYDQYQNCPSVAVIPAWFWTAYCTVGTAVVAAGGWSYQRPACDIFVAGVTQAPSTFYAMAVLWQGLPTLPGWSTAARAAAAIAFILNAPLLPLYPLLTTTNLSLGQINAVLHSWLLVAWSSQGYVLWQVARSLEAETVPPPHALPVKKNKAC